MYCMTAFSIESERQIILPFTLQDGEMTQERPNVLVRFRGNNLRLIVIDRTLRFDVHNMQGGCREYGMGRRQTD